MSQDFEEQMLAALEQIGELPLEQQPTAINELREKLEAELNSSEN
ncbi:hypothetical protein [Candidatus Rhodoluna planktonica]|nr:hypothetical protein [Candidatus Rhodoluna planktonica]